MIFGNINSVVESVKITPESNPDGLMVDGVWNSIEWMDTQPFRLRSELLVIKDNKIFLQLRDKPDQYNRRYKIPGGGTEPGVSLIDQAKKECEEEARIKTKNVVDTGIVFTTNYGENYPEWQVKDLHPRGLKYEGVITHVLVGWYDGKYTGHVHEKDKDEKMIRDGKFYDISNIKYLLSKTHIDALKRVNVI